ncbi:hypothetical protein G5C64_23100 [Vibrio diabolicus]|uniref:hypothetical protein n=1 Tax=Vibrio diabolicus TaxID=50719 RepID=UPI0021511097|nr:hypothetical protein [Vibrio diabolicus]MCE3221681.1 hypothetical protein [Vibrio diabolicus]MCS0306343.1 hypothetical protein [Vibrio diabolicus]
MKIEVLDNGEWIERPPVNGDRVRQIVGAAHSVEFIWNGEKKELIPIVVTSLDGAILHSSDFSKITCYENTNLTVRGALAIPDRRFSLPLLRDDGRLTLFEVQVINGEFEAVLNFPTSGQFVYSDVQANHDLPEPAFTVNPIKIDVLRKTT